MSVQRPNSDESGYGSVGIVNRFREFASTFTARVVGSSLANPYATISSAIGSLSGPLHGGANEEVLIQLEEIGSPDKVKPWLDLPNLPYLPDPSNQTHLRRQVTFIDVDLVVGEAARHLDPLLGSDAIEQRMRVSVTQFAVVLEDIEAAGRHFAPRRRAVMVIWWNPSFPA